MNERIRELEEQCWEPTQYGPPWFNAEKFALLIVRECAELAREWEDDYVVEDTAPFHSDVKIKKHFGVES
jgi:hypothetical protein